MPESLRSRRQRFKAAKKDLRNQVKSMSTSVGASTSSANTKKSNDDTCKSNEHASLAQELSKDHTESTRSTQESRESNDSSRCQSEEMPDLKKGNAAPGPASVEYSMAPSSEKLSITKRKVPKTSKPPLSMRMRKTKGLGKTPPKTRKNRKKQEPITTQPELTTISKPDAKYFTDPPASPQSTRFNEYPDKDSASRHKASADDDEGFTLGIASTITSAHDMPPAPTVDSEGEDWSSDEESEKGPPMSTIGEGSYSYNESAALSDEEFENSPSMSTIGDESSSFSESTVSTTLQTKKMSKQAKEMMIKEIHDSAVRLMRKGELDLALSKFEDIRDVLTEEYNEDHHRVAASLHNIGIVKIRRGEVEEASSIFREAIRIKKAMLGKYHPKVAETLLELGITLISRDEALVVFTEALKICRRDDRKEFFLSDVQLSKILNNIGVVHFERGRGATAIQAFEKALKTQQYISKNGGDDLSTAIVLPMSNTIYNIACVHMSCEEYDEAIEGLELADSLQQSILEKSNPVVLNTLESLAYCNAKEGFLTVAMSVSGAECLYRLTWLCLYRPFCFQYETFFVYSSLAFSQNTCKCIFLCTFSIYVPIISRSTKKFFRIKRVPMAFMPLHALLQDGTLLAFILPTGSMTRPSSACEWYNPSKRGILARRAEDCTTPPLSSAPSSRRKRPFSLPLSLCEEK